MEKNVDKPIKDNRDKVQAGHSSPLNSYMVKFFYLIINPDKISYFFGKTLNLSPNLFTIIGLCIAFLSAFYFALGKFVIGGFVLLLSLLFDVFDGLIAKSFEKTSAFGGVLDSALDRYIEILQVSGLTIYYDLHGEKYFSIIALFYVLGSFSTSYIKAIIEKHEGIKCEVGFMQRLERMMGFVILSVFSIFNVHIIYWGVLLVAIGSNITAIQRLLYGKKVLKGL